MKPSSSGQGIALAVILVAAAVFTTYQYVRQSISKSVRTTVDFSVNAIEQASKSLAGLEQVLHYDKAKGEFTLRSRNSSAERVVIKNTDLGSFFQRLEPKPAKVAVVYDVADFPTTASRDEFEWQTRHTIGSGGPEVQFVTSTRLPEGMLLPVYEQEN